MSRALDDVIVLDFGRQFFTALSAAFLADFGARVIRLDALPAQSVEARPGPVRWNHEADLIHRNKESLALDLRSSQGQAVLRDLVAKADVVSQWRSTVFLRDTGLSARGWLLAVMRAVEAVGLPEFTLADVYAHEDALQRLYPANQNVRPKIRQQLQVLRDRGWIEFNGRGTYRLIRSR